MGCIRPVWAHGACRYHYERFTHNREPAPKGWGKLRQKARRFQAVEEAALAYAAAETDDQYERAWRRLYMASIRHAFGVIRKRQERATHGRPGPPEEEARTEEDEGRHVHFLRGPEDP